MHKTWYHNLIEKKVLDMLELMGTGKDFLNMTPITQAVRLTVSKWDFLKLESFCLIKDTKAAFEWEKSLPAIYLSETYCLEHTGSNNKQS